MTLPQLPNQTLALTWSFSLGKLLKWDIPAKDSLLKIQISYQTVNAGIQFQFKSFSLLANLVMHVNVFRSNLWSSSAWVSQHWGGPGMTGQNPDVTSTRC